MHAALTLASLLAATIPVQAAPVELEASATTQDIQVRAAAANPAPSANTGKRGLAYNDPTYTQLFSLTGQNSRVSWAYNWGSEPYQDVSSGKTATNTINPALHYIPMLWSNASVLTTPWVNNVNNAIRSYGADAVLGFNEPDLCGGGGSSCMSVSSAVASWNRYIQPFAGKVSLVSPAVSNAGSPAGLTWLSSFLSNCTNCRVDAIALHWYGAPSADGAQAFQTYIQNAYNKFQKPIYITEFGTNGGNDTQVLGFLKIVLPWIANQSWITRVAYFFDAPGTPYLINGTNLSAEGLMYNNNTGL